MVKRIWIPILVGVIVVSVAGYLFYLVRGLNLSPEVNAVLIASLVSAVSILLNVYITINIENRKG